MESTEFKITTDQEEVRIWMEEHGGIPAVTNRSQNGGEGILAIKFGDDPTMEEVSWQEFFDRFESSSLALRYDGEVERSGIFAYSFLHRDEANAEIESSGSDSNDMPEDDIPLENLYSSAAVADVNVANTDTSDYPGHETSGDAIS